MALLTKNQQEIGDKLLMKKFMALMTKNQQEIGSSLLMKIFMALLTKKSTRNRVYFINQDIYCSVDQQEIGSY